LDHKAGDHPVEGQTVVKAVLHQLEEVLHSDGGRLGVQLQLDLAAVFHFNYDHTFSAPLQAARPAAGIWFQYTTNTLAVPAPNPPAGSAFALHFGHISPVPLGAM